MVVPEFAGGQVKKEREKTSADGGGGGELLPKRMEVGPRGVGISGHENLLRSSSFALSEVGRCYN